MKKQTATEFLFEKLWETPKDKLNWNAILEQAKEMEKQQIKDAYNHGYRSGEIDSQGFSEMELLHHDVSEFENANNYYIETYGK